MNVLRGKAIFRWLDADPTSKDQAWIEVTPAIAEALWARRPDLQRRFNDARAKFFAFCLRTGKLRTTHQGIGIHCNGGLYDGQKRIWAIMTTGVTAVMAICKGLTDEDVMVLDMPEIRNFAGNLTMAGMPTTSKEIAIARRLYEGRSSNKYKDIGVDKMKDILDVYGEAIAFSGLLWGIKERGLSSASVCAPVARAYLFEDRDLLGRFCVVFKTGEISDRKENSIRLLREFMIKNKGYTSTSVGRLETYDKAEASIRAYLDQRVITSLRGGTRELWPLPHEEDESNSVDSSSSPVATPIAAKTGPDGGKVHLL